MSLKYGITVRFDDDVKKLAQQFPRAAVAVLNRGVQSSQKVVTDKLASEYNLTKKTIRSRIYVRKANIKSLWATIRFSQKGINPFLFLKSKKPTVHREPVILEIKKGTSTYVGNKFFTNIGRQTGLLRVMTQPAGNPRSQLALMRYIKGDAVFKTTEIVPTIKNFVEPYLARELPRVVEVWFKTGREIS